MFAHISINDLLPLISPQPRVVENPRAEIIAYLRKSNSLVEQLYQLDKQAKFDAETTAPENKRFAIDRLTSGAEMLRSLWWTAWMKSEAAS